MRIVCKTTGETVHSYEAYLKTDHWKNTRQEYLLSLGDSAKCKVCFSRQKLNVHHKTYYGLGKEQFGDFMLLCEECHHSLNGIIKRMERNDAFGYNAKNDKLYRVGKEMRKIATAQVMSKGKAKGATLIIRKGGKKQEP